jgi:hypothetical protein
MPKVNSAELGKGFWVALGVLLALVVAGILSMMVRTVSSKRAG